MAIGAGHRGRAIKGVPYHAQSPMPLGPTTSTTSLRERTRCANGRMRVFPERDTVRNRTTHGGSERVVMLQTKFTELLGCTVPLQQAGMGKLASPALAAAVADAGGLGMVSGIGAAPPEYVAKILDGLRRSTSGAFGANFIVDGVRESGKLDADFLKVLEVAASRAPVVEFCYEQPDAELVEIAHAGGARVSWQLGSAAEAVAAERAGCDLIVAQGTEAGGHVRGKIGLLALLSEVLPSVKVPVVAAGGIGTGRAMAAALAAGASAVRVGTRFVAAEEAGTHPAYVDRLIAAEAKD